MNAWTFVIAAYALTLAGLGLLLFASWIAMRRSETEAERMRRDREA